MPAISYRCVCGETVLLGETDGGQCAACDRKYSADVLRRGFADTVTVRSDSSTQDPSKQLRSEDAIGGHDPTIGRVLGHYEVIEKLGDGGMGSVYRALDQSLQRYVALKVIRTSEASSTDTKQLQRLLQEAIAQARVNHPNVVHIYFVGHQGESPFLAMELVDGETLADRLRHEQLSFAQTVELAIQVTDALRHAVDFDILHGDIKPSNVLLNDAGAVKLSDFGLARRLSQSTDNGDGISGTPAYMSPEAMNPESTDIRSDIYSLGVTLFEMTFGRLPYSFQGKSVVHFVETHTTATVEFPEPWPVDVPKQWRSCLTKMLAKSPADRHASYDELMGDLKAVQPGNLPKAGRVQRALAWLVDIALANTVLQIMTIPFDLSELTTLFDRNPLIALLLGLAAFTAPVVASIVQAFWGSTPGKKLFQLRIVDRHGLPPSKRALAGRMVFQMLPLWISSIGIALQAIGAGVLLIFIGVLVLPLLLLTAGLAVVRRDGRSLHDLLFDTKVVLDI